MILVGLKWESGRMWRESNACLADKLGLEAWRPGCLGRCCVGRLQGLGGDSNMPVDHASDSPCSPLFARRPLPPRPAHLGLPTTQPVSSLSTTSILPRDTSGWHRCTILFNLSCVFICFWLRLSSNPKLHRPPVALYLGTLTPDDPTLPKSTLPDCHFAPQHTLYTVLFHTCKHASH